MIDVATGAAMARINAVKAAMADVDGNMNKLKAGGSAAFAGIGGGAVAATAALGGLLVIGKQSISVASQLAESNNAVNVTFKENAAAIHELGKESVESFGLSEGAFNQAAVTFSSFAESIAGEGGDVVGTLRDLMTRAVDFASVMDMDVNRAMQLFTSTLAGESEGIRRYGKDMSAAAVTSFALAEGLITNKRELVGTTKAQATYGLLMKLTADAQGDFQNTSDSLANSQRRLSGNLENISGNFGSILIPVVADATDAFADLTDRVESTMDSLLGLVGVTDDSSPSDDSTSKWERYGQVISKAVEYGPIGMSARMAGKAIEGVTKIVTVQADAVGWLGRKFGVINDDVETVTRTYGKHNAALMASVNTYDTATTMQREFSRALGRGNVGLSDAAAAQDGYREAVGEARDATREQTDAVDALRRAHQDLAGDTLSTLEAEIAFREQVAESTEVLGDKNTTMDQAATAMIDVVRGAEDVAGAMLDEKNATMDTRAGMDLYNTSMLTQASTLEG
ncbi:MAG TPA: hypothetical protein VMW33_05995, partial [Ilumatobacteraceae bacterium]|nr:hypothetical protein [Ilumatobacteraceae bacterium]